MEPDNATRGISNEAMWWIIMTIIIAAILGAAYLYLEGVKATTSPNEHPLTENLPCETVTWELSEDGKRAYAYCDG